MAVGQGSSLKGSIVGHVGLSCGFGIGCNFGPIGLRVPSLLGGVSSYSQAHAGLETPVTAFNFINSFLVFSSQMKYSSSSCYVIYRF